MRRALLGGPVCCSWSAAGAAARAGDGGAGAGGGLGQSCQSIRLCATRLRRRRLRDEHLQAARRRPRRRPCFRPSTTVRRPRACVRRATSTASAPPSVWRIPPAQVSWMPVLVRLLIRSATSTATDPPPGNESTALASAPRRCLVFQKSILCAAALLACGLWSLSSSRPAVGSWRAPTDGVLRGELAVYVADSLDGKSETSYYLRDARGEEQRLYFTGEPALAPGAADRSSGYAVRRWRPGHAGSTRSATDVGRGRPFVADRRDALSRRAASRSCSSIWGTGSIPLRTTAMGRLVGDADSIRNYYLYDSYQTQDISAQVIGPIKYSLPQLQQHDTRNLANSLRVMVPGTFQHYLWYFGQRTSSATGLASAPSVRRSRRPRTPGTTVDELCGAGARAGTQLRDAALVVAALRVGAR